MTTSLQTLICLDFSCKTRSWLEKCDNKFARIQTYIVSYFEASKVRNIISSQYIVHLQKKSLDSFLMFTLLNNLEKFLEVFLTDAQNWLWNEMKKKKGEGETFRSYDFIATIL